MHLIFDANRSMTQIWASRESYGWEFFVYGLTESGDARVCPSLAMACDLVGTDPRPILNMAPFLSQTKETTQ
jgi:hypothetical protein